MSTSHNHEIQIRFEQLKWIDHRRMRIIESIGAHFGREKLSSILKKAGISGNIFLQDARYQDCLGASAPDQLIHDLAQELLYLEALTIKTFRSTISSYPLHVDEQTLFGARNAGQDAGRHYLSNSYAGRAYGNLTLSEVVNTILTLHYHGALSDKECFVSVRPLSDATIHFKSCPYSHAWEKAGADMALLADVQAEWIRGILDILSPNVLHEQLKSIAKGHPYGLENFSLKSNHA